MYRVIFVCLLDEDSEPILGSWFEETTSPPAETCSPPPSTTDILDTEDTKTQEPECQSFVPEKREPDGVIVLT